MGKKERRVPEAEETQHYFDDGHDDHHFGFLVEVFLCYRGHRNAFIQSEVADVCCR